MAIVRADVILPYESNLPGDIAVNTFHFQVVFGGDPSEQVAEVVARLTEFYNGDITPPGVNLANYISEYVKRSTNACRIDLYNLEEPEPRTPISTQFTLDTTTDGLSLPFEVALCSSYRAAPVVGVSRSSTRGRQFIGPLTRTALDGDDGGLPYPLENLVTVLAGAAERLANHGAVNDVQWVVYSRALDETYPVVAGWVDNEFDTQRRRQVDADARTVWTAVPPV